MKPTLSRDVLHYCRKCGESFASKGRDTAHARLRAHWYTAHGFTAAQACHSNCSFKETFQEALDGRMYYGVGATRS